MVSKAILTIPLALALSLSFNHHVVGEGYKEPINVTPINNSLVEVDYKKELEYIHEYKMYVFMKEQEEKVLEEKRKQEEIIRQRERQEEIRKAELKRQEEVKRKEELRKKQLEAQKPRGRTITVNASSYVAFCDTGCTGVTATGYDVSNTIYYQGYRIIAVDTSIIPLYSIVEIEGNDERFIALDTGGAIDGHRIDILVANESIAWKFGRKRLKVTIIREGK